jgi:hypothetical protein
MLDSGFAGELRHSKVIAVARALAVGVVRAEVVCGWPLPMSEKVERTLNASPIG